MPAASAAAVFVWALVVLRGLAALPAGSALFAAALIDPVALVLSAGLVAASLRLPSPTAYFLAAYLVAYAQIVLLVVVLSFALPESL